MRRALPFVIALALTGCTLGVERTGDPRFLERSYPRETGATCSEVAHACGPPDEIRQVGEELWFVYRYRETWRNSLVLNYYLNVFTYARRHGTESTLVFVFDPQDKLRYTALARAD